MTGNQLTSDSFPLIVVIGSANTDMVIKTSHLPAPGETIIGGNFYMGGGGKGANQAVAASRLGARVSLVCKTGNDVFGRNAREQFEREGIDTGYILYDGDTPSGVAMIIVDEQGENAIVVAPGANTLLKPADLANASGLIQSAGILLTQLEIPLATIEYLAQMTDEKKIPLILNPAPACELPEELLRKVAVITPNRKEAEMISGINIENVDDAKQAASAIKNKGVATVVITLGNEGALLFHEDTYALIPALPVTAIDTTAAGDVFNGALAVALSENKTMFDAVCFACKAAAISVTKPGAQASAPFRREVDR